MPITGSLPSIKGVSPLGVHSTVKEPSGAATSQVQPEPKTDPGADMADHCSCRFSKEPKLDSMEVARSPTGSPPPLGFMICQNIVWLECCPPLFLTERRMSSGTEFKSATSSSIGLSARSG